MRTREHARQIAQQLSQEEETDQDYYEPPPKAPLHNQISIDIPITSSNLGVINPSSSGRRSPKRIHNKTLGNKSFEEDGQIQQVKRTSNKKLDEFFEEQHSFNTMSSKPPRSGPLSLVSKDTSVSSRSRGVTSMPSFPSNSSMQARNISTQQYQSPDYKSIDNSYPLTRSKGSNVSWKSTSTASSGKKIRFATPGGVSTASTGASTANTSTSFYDDDLFIKADHGFSFDAFGLDENVVDQEVAEAMRDLEGEWGEEFPVQSFDSPNGSRASSPPRGGDDGFEDGFEDGFRVSGMTTLPRHVMQSPNDSDRSSLTSSTEKTGQDYQPNYFKEKATFHKSKQNTSWEKSFNVQDWSAFDSSAFDDSFSPGYARSEPGLESNFDMVPPKRESSKISSENADDPFKGFQDMPNFPESPASVTRKNVKYHSDVDDFGSDTAVDSDSEIIADSGIVHVNDLPTEVRGKKQRKARKLSKSLKEKKEDSLEISFSTGKGGVGILGKNTLEKEFEEPTRNRFTRDEGSDKMHKYQKEQITDNVSFREKESVHDIKRSQVSTPSNSYAHSDIADLRSQSQSDFSNILDRYRDTSYIATSSRTNGNNFEQVEKEKEQSSNYTNYVISDTERSGTNDHVEQQLQAKLQGSSHWNKAASGIMSDKGQKDARNHTDEVKRHEYAIKNSFTGTRTNDNKQIGDEYHENFIQQNAAYRGASSSEEQNRRSQHYQDSSQSIDRPTRRLNYREKREMELKMQQEERERKEAEENAKVPPKRDVAALIRKRVAANKRIAVKDTEATSGNENFTDMKNRLRKVSMESKITQFKAREDEIQKQEPEFLVKSIKKVDTQPNKHILSQNSVEESREIGSTESRNSVHTPEQTLVQRDTPSPLAIKKDSLAPMAAVHELIKNRSKATSSKHGDFNLTTTEEPPPASDMQPQTSDPSADARNKLNAMLSSRMIPSPNRTKPNDNVEGSQMTVASKRNDSESTEDAKSKLNAMLASRMAPPPAQDVKDRAPDSSSENAKSKLSAMLAGRLGSASSTSELKEDKNAGTSQPCVALNQSSKTPSSLSGASPAPSDGRPAIKDDPKYDRYFRMLKVGMPMEVVKHAMERDGVEPSVMDGDHNKPAGFDSGVPLKDDPKYTKYFKMLKMGLPMGAVKNSLERDGLDPSVMDQDHNLPANNTEANKTREEKKPKDTHRRTRLHWDTVRKVRSNSLWAKIDQDEELEDIMIDEDEFQELFQAELTPAAANKIRSTGNNKKGAAVRVIDSKRANNGGIILARLKITHDDMAEAVDRIDNSAISAEQMQNIVEYLPTSEERKALEEYMLSGGVDAAEKFHGLCECEKFMVAMMTVKHAKRKVRSLLFKSQFQNCLESLVTDATIVEKACDELSSSIRLRKLLGIVLNVGNRLNTAGVSGKSKAGAFKLDSLLKLNHAKAFDKKTTFLHYIVLVVQRNNELLLRFKDDLPTVMKADRVYWDQVEQDLEEVENQLENVRQVALHQARLVTRRWRKKKKQQQQQRQRETEDDDSLSDCSLSLEEEVELLRATEIGVFTLGAIKKVSALRDKVETTKLKFSKLLEYFGEEESGDSQPHDVFNIIVTFCRDFEKAKEQVSENMKKKRREERKNKRVGSRPTLPNKSNSPVKEKSSKSMQVPNQHNNDDQQNSYLNKQTEKHRSVSSFVHRQESEKQSNGQNAKGDYNLAYAQTHSSSKKKEENDLLTPSLAQQQLSRRLSETPEVKGLRQDPQKFNTGNVLRNVRTREQTTMRQKAMERRRKMKSSTSVTTGTRSTETEPSIRNIQSPDRKYTGLPESPSKNDTVDDALSPRSSIRQRRRNQMRQSATRPNPSSADCNRV